MTNLFLFISFYLCVFIYSNLYIRRLLKEWSYSNSKEPVEAKDLASPHPPEHHLRNQLIFGKLPPFQDWERLQKQARGRSCGRRPSFCSPLLQREIHFQFFIFFQLPELINLGGEQVFLSVRTDRKSFIKGACAGHHVDL